MGCMADYSWELKYEEFEFSGKSMVKFKLLPDSFYERQWWYGEDFNKLVCNLKYDITGDSVVIELDMLSSPAAHNLLCDVLLISLYYVVTEDSCKQIGKDMISESLQLITSKGGNNINNKSFLISIHVEFILALLLDENQMNALEEYKSSVLTKNRPVLTALKTTTIDCNNVKDFIDDSEACAICFEEYLTTVLGSKMIEMRCSFDLDMYENLGGRSSDDIILLPCSHKFHANCIAFWLKINNSCPICRFEMPSIATFAGVICLFYVGVDLSKSD